MKNNLVFFLLISLLSYNRVYVKNSDTLHEFYSYTKTLDEYPEPDNDNLLNPDYTSFHKKHIRSKIGRSFSKLFTSLHLKKKAAWSVENFKILLEKLVKEREANSLVGDFVQKLTPKEGSKLVVWGDLQGAFHSLTRDLVKLEEEGLIDNKLKIKENSYFIFNGDLINRSPYSLEILTLVMKIIEQNPNNAFYIKGNHESNNYWHDYGIRRELELMAKHLSKEKIPLNNLLGRFFLTLPLALYLKSKDGKSPKFVCINHHAKDYNGLKEEFFADFLLTEDDGTLKTFNLSKAKKSELSVSIKALIKGVSRSNVYIPTEGLTFLPPENGSSSWTLLSSPTKIYQKLYDFNNDAFGIIKVKKKLEFWIIDFYKQNARDMNGFQMKSLNLLTGEDISKEKEDGKAYSSKFKKNVVQLGSTLWTSEHGGLSDAVLKGTSVIVKKVNASGGINGSRLKVIFLDDEYKPAAARKNAKKLLADYNVNIMLSPVGSPTLKAYFDLIKEKKILMMFAVSGGEDFRVPEDHIVFFRASFHQEATALTKYALETKKLKRLAIFYQDDAFGKSLLKGAQDTFKLAGIKKFLELPYQRRSVNFSKQIKQIKEYSPDGIFFFATDKSSVALIRGLGAHNLVETKLFGCSDLSIKWFGSFLKKLGLSFITVHVVPKPEGSNLEIVKEFKRDVRKMHYPEDSFLLESYINASLAVYILNKVKGEVTKEKVIEIINNIKNFNFKGLTLNLDPNTRSLFHKVWIETEDGELIEQEV
ncbi:ABC transporter substrate-binding protein [Candidatus Babeliales bacterium]|nr:ABC transporter substrate-binding protein [Candidatus Babeliales bacterium]